MTDFLNNVSLTIYNQGGTGFLRLAVFITEHKLIIFINTTLIL